MALPFVVRAALVTDARACAAIYCAAARTSVCTWAYMQPEEEALAAGNESEATVANRLSGVVTSSMPFFVAEAPSPTPSSTPSLLGYAYVSPYRPREGWRTTCEDSVYVVPDAQRRGVGNALLSALLPAAAAAGFRLAVAIISVEHSEGASCEGSPSVRLHAAHGFALAGRLPAAGWKSGRWLDAAFMQRALGVGAGAPPDDDALPPTLRVPPGRRA